jgi:hypothetical protein
LIIKGEYKNKNIAVKDRQYPMFIAQCGVFAWAAWSRKSFGMLGNYILLLSIDTAALIRLVTL